MFIDTLHEAYELIQGKRKVTFTKLTFSEEDLRKHPWARGINIKYCYCESRLYLFKFKWNGFTFAKGSSPADAYFSFALHKDGTIET